MTQLYTQGHSVVNIATKLQRQPSAIESRLGKLDLKPDSQKGDREWLKHVRRKRPRAYEKWDANEDNQLKGFIEQNMDIGNIAERLQRTVSEIKKRISFFNS